MSEVQLHLAIGIPAGLVALNFLIILWQSRGLKRTFLTRIDALECVINARFEAVDAKLAAAHQGLLRVEQVLDARLKYLEER